jgi:uncharacterized protein
MKLDLREIIGAPGAHVSFEYELDISDCSVEGAFKVDLPAYAKGSIRNVAGALVFTAKLNASVLCKCARCLLEFTKHISLDVEAALAESLQDEDNPDIFLLEGNFADLDEILRTAFMLEIPQRFLCSDDCKGLCGKCGKNLNDGPCSCTDEEDPRLAVLRQLLED